MHPLGFWAGLFHKANSPRGKLKSHVWLSTLHCGRCTGIVPAGARDDVSDESRACFHFMEMTLRSQIHEYSWSLCLFSGIWSYQMSKNNFMEPQLIYYTLKLADRHFINKLISNQVRRFGEKQQQLVKTNLDPLFSLWHGAIFFFF